MLIMAFTDNTARVSPLPRNEINPETASRDLDVPLYPAGAALEGPFNVEYQRASTELALAVIEAMLRAHHKVKQAQSSSKYSGPLPLDPVHRIGLETAHELLHYYADTLAPEGGE
jgi:hypothetical protein